MLCMGADPDIWRADGMSMEGKCLKCEHGKRASPVSHVRGRRQIGMQAFQLSLCLPRKHEQTALSRKHDKAVWPFDPGIKLFIVRCMPYPVAYFRKVNAFFVDVLLVGNKHIVHLLNQEGTFVS